MVVVTAAALNPTLHSNKKRTWVTVLRGVQAKAMEPNPLQKKKVWEGVQPQLRTDDARAANFKGAAMQTAEGPVTASTLTAAHIG